jgi:hypothetical protein
MNQRMNDEERWRPCAGFPAYEVSDHGRVRRVAPSSRGGYLGHAIATTTTARGFVRIALTRGGRQRGSLSVARLVLLSFRPAPPNADALEPHHLDGDITNCALSNLRWQTAERARRSRAARAGKRKSATKTRPCLRCGGHFPSTWAGHRLCSTCGHADDRPCHGDRGRGNGRPREVRARAEEDRRDRLRLALNAGMARRTA